MPSATPSPNVTSPECNEGHGATDPEPPSRLRIDVVQEAGDWSIRAGIVEAVNQAADALVATHEVELKTFEACVALSCDEHVARLNKTYRGKSTSTNVLSFPASGSRPEANFLGDVVLAEETVAREAEALGLPFRHHLQHLIVHGLLHLLGFDHECDDDAQAMETVEIRTLERLGIANPYETSASARRIEHTKAP